jgi:hypothetical protein
MKQYFFTLATSITLLSACGENKKTETSATSASTEKTSTASNESSDEKIGEFSVDGKSVTGRASTQYFGSDKEKSNFSVLCQHNESATSANFELLQITFTNEKDATTNTALKLYDGSQLPMTEPEAGSYTVALSGVGDGFKDQQFTGSDKSTGSVIVSDRTVIVKDLVLFTRDGGKRTVNAKIPF